MGLRLQQFLVRRCPRPAAGCAVTTLDFESLPQRCAGNALLSQLRLERLPFPLTCRREPGYLSEILFSRAHKWAIDFYPAISFGCEILIVVAKAVNAISSAAIGASSIVNSFIVLFLLVRL